MAITYPLSLPTGLRQIRITPIAVVSESRSPFSLKSQIQQHQGQLWQAEIAVKPMTRASAEEWISFLLKLNGKYGTFLLGDPSGATPRGIATGTPLVNGASQTGNALITDGWTPSQTNILRAGDYIQLGTGSTSRLYKNLEDTNSDAGGNATLTLWPNLRSSPADNSAIVTSSAKGVFRLATNEMAYDISEAKIYGIAFPAIEAI